MNSSESKLTDFSEDMSQITYTRNRVICVKAVPPVKKIYLETGSSQSGKRCYGAGLFKGSGACFLPFSIIPRVLVGKSPDLSSQNNGFNCTNFVGAAFVPRIAKVIKAISDF